MSAVDAGSWTDWDKLQLERFSLGLTQFNLRILQSPLGFNGIRDG